MTPPPEQLTQIQAELIAFGSDVIRQTRALILDLWNHSSFSFELKADNTPVSEVDLRCEELVRKLVKTKYPNHGIIGEELGVENGDREFVWTIDPIDGTQNLINRIPTFGTILGLLYQGKPVMGWIDHPVLDLQLTGGLGLGAFQNGKPVHLADLSSTTLSPSDVIGTNCPATFGRSGQIDVLWEILRFHPHSRIYYDVFSHSLAITGSLAVMVEYNLKIWDISASQALVEAAGGEYREISRGENSEGYVLYNAVFGKPRAVELISGILR
jgi:fructose-1,6-bisphosphatase/inositol monophosphatase family enzyme